MVRIATWNVRLKVERQHRSLRRWKEITWISLELVNVDGLVQEGRRQEMVLQLCSQEKKIFMPMVLPLSVEVRKIKSLME